MSIKDHLTKSDIEVASSSTSPYQSYRRHIKRSPHMARVYKRWLGASIMLTGITGGLESVSAVVEPLGRLGREVLTFGGSCAVCGDPGLLRALPGVLGNDDRNRGVPFMASSLGSRRTLSSC